MFLSLVRIWLEKSWRAGQHVTCAWLLHQSQYTVQGSPYNVVSKDYDFEIVKTMLFFSLQMGSSHNMISQDTYFSGEHVTCAWLLHKSQCTVRGSPYNVISQHSDFEIVLFFEPNNGGLHIAWLLHQSQCTVRGSPYNVIPQYSDFSIALFLSPQIGVST